MASTLEEQGSKEDVLFLELPAPPGWNKKVSAISAFYLIFLSLLYLAHLLCCEFAGTSVLEFELDYPYLEVRANGYPWN